MEILIFLLCIVAAVMLLGTCLGVVLFVGFIASLFLDDKAEYDGITRNK